MKFTITPLGGAGRPVVDIVGAIVRYLQPQEGAGLDQAGRGPPGSAGVNEGSTSEYYADRGESPGRWRGQGATALGLAGEVETEDFARVLAGRDPATGARLVTARGSAGRRPKLGVGNETRLGDDGSPMYGVNDAAAALGLEIKQARRMLRAGAWLALCRFFGLDSPPPAEDRYLLPVVDGDGTAWVPDSELCRVEDARPFLEPTDLTEGGPPGELLTIAQAAELVAVTPRYLRGLAKQYEDNQADIDQAEDAGLVWPHAYLVAQRDPDDHRGRWLVTRAELDAFVRRRKPPAVRVAYDLTLTTEKSLSVLALLGGDDVRRDVLDAIQAGNDWAMDWLEMEAAATRVKDEVVPVQGWMVASFRHLTSRALDPFAHWHNIVPNSVEDQDGVRRALDARGVYRNIKAASAFATAQMRWLLTTRLGVRWRRSAHHDGWEIAGIAEEVLRAFSRRRHEIEEALQELEEIIGRPASLDEVGQIVLKTRPGKKHTTVEALLAEWWERAEAVGLTPEALQACLGEPIEPPEPDPESLFAALAAPDGICQNGSVFHYGDVLTALTNLAIDDPDGGEPQPLLVPADELADLAGDFLACRWVEQVANESDTSPARFSTREMLAVQDRIVHHYRSGRHAGTGRVPGATVNAALAQHPQLTDEQQRLVQAFCTSGHRIQCAVGHPGTGKTTAMAAARDAWRATGWHVVGAAVKGEAARTLGNAAGIPTETLAWYLAHPDPMRAPLDARTVLIVDEASTVSDRDLDRLIWLVEQTGATLRLIGDPQQHGAVEAGGMYRVLCERHGEDTPELSQTHRLRDPHDLAAANAMREGRVKDALHFLNLAGHLHVVEDELDAYTQVLTRWWNAHRQGQDHPMVDKRNAVRRILNRLAHQLLVANGEVAADGLNAAEGRRFAAGDRVIARTPDRKLHPPDRPTAYVRNGAVGTVVATARGDEPADDRLTVAFDGIGTIDLPRRFFDHHEIAEGHHDVGIDHAYAVTSYAVTGSTHAVSTSRIDETSSRAETYVDITRGQDANHLYLTRADDPLDGENLPRTPPEPLEDEIGRHLANSIGERTAWELREDMRQRQAERAGRAMGL